MENLQYNVNGDDDLHSFGFSEGIGIGAPNLRPFQFSLCSEKTKAKRKRLAERIVENDKLVGQLMQLKEENQRLFDLQRTAKEVSALFQSEKEKLLESESSLQKLTECCTELERRLEKQQLKNEELEDKVHTQTLPVDMKQMIVVYLQLAHRVSNDITGNKLLRREITLQRKLQDYCEKAHINVPSIKTSPRKRKTIASTEEPQKPLKEGYIGFPNKELNRVAISCSVGVQTDSVQTHDQSTQYSKTSTTRSTSTASLVQRHNVGTCFPEPRPAPSVDVILKEMLSWPPGIQPLSPINDSLLHTVAASTRSFGTCTILCNVEKEIDFATAMPRQIKTSDSRPPSRNMYDKVKDEIGISSNYCTLANELLSYLSFNEMYITTEQQKRFAALWSAFGEWLFYILKPTSEWSEHSTSTSNITQEELTNFLKSLHENTQSSLETAPIFGNKANDYEPSPLPTDDKRSPVFTGADLIASHQPLVPRTDIKCRREIKRKRHHKHAKAKCKAQTAVNFLSSLKTFKNRSYQHDNAMLSAEEQYILHLTHGNYLTLEMSGEGRNIPLMAATENMNGNKTTENSQLPVFEQHVHTEIDVVSTNEETVSQIAPLSLNPARAYKIPDLDFTGDSKLGRNHIKESLKSTNKNKSSSVIESIKINKDSELPVADQLAVKEAHLANANDQTVSNIENVFALREQVPTSKMSLKLPNSFSTNEINTIPNHTENNIDLLQVSEKAVNSQLLNAGNKRKDYKIQENIKQTSYKNQNTSIELNLENTTKRITPTTESRVALSKAIKTAQTPLELPELKITNENYSTLKQTKNCAYTLRTNKNNQPVAANKGLKSNTMQENSQSTAKEETTLKKKEFVKKSERISLFENEVALSEQIIAPHIVNDLVEKSQLHLSKEQIIKNNAINEDDTACNSFYPTTSGNLVKNISGDKDAPESSLKINRKRKSSLTISNSFPESANSRLTRLGAKRLLLNVDVGKDDISTTNTSCHTNTNNNSNCDNASMDITPTSTMTVINSNCFDDSPASPDVPTTIENIANKPVKVSILKERSRKGEPIGLIMHLINDAKSKDKAKLQPDTIKTQAIVKKVSMYFNRSLDIATGQDNLLAEINEISTDQTVIDNAIINALVQDITEENKSCYLNRLQSVIIYFETMQPNYLERFMNTIEQHLFNLKQLPKSDLALKYVKLYLHLIRLQSVLKNSDSYQNPARLLIAKILYFYNRDMPLLVNEVVRQYPTVLPHREERNYDHSDPLITVIKHLLMTFKYDMTDPNGVGRHLISLLRFTYHFKAYEPTRGQVLEYLMDKLKSDKLNQLSYAFVLFCRRSSISKFKVIEDVVDKHLVSLAESYCDLILKTNAYDDRLIVILDSISKIIKQQPCGIDVKSYTMLFKRLLIIGVSPKVQEAAVQALLRLQKFGFKDIIGALLSFKPNYELSPMTRAMLRTFVSRRREVQLLKESS